jgi:hypothetical protein
MSKRISSQEKEIFTLTMGQLRQSLAGLEAQQAASVVNFVCGLCRDPSNRLFETAKSTLIPCGSQLEQALPNR